jgi:hypothetical protein
MNVRLLEPAIEEISNCWLIDLGGRFVGVQAHAGWYVRIEDRVMALDDESKFVPLGPLLDVAAEVFSAFLQRSALAKPAYSQQILGFPKELLLKHIFHTSYSSYWPERALAWLAADRSLWPHFQEELHLFSQNKLMPQAARQHAKQLLKQMAI